MITSLRLLLWMIIVTGLAYPLLITAIAQFTMPYRANGQILTRNEKKIGSALIAQKFTSDKYFWSRPSAVDFNPLPSGGSNLGPTSAELQKIVQTRREMLLYKHPGSENVPSELLYASGSGLDPHITPAAAYFQVKRVAKARDMDDDEGDKKIREIINRHIIKKKFGFLGTPCVNVLLLNIALDEDETRKSP